MAKKKTTKKMNANMKKGAKTAARGGKAVAKTAGGAAVVAGATRLGARAATARGARKAAKGATKIPVLRGRQLKAAKMARKSTMNKAAGAAAVTYVGYKAATSPQGKKAAKKVSTGAKKAGKRAKTGFVTYKKKLASGKTITVRRKAGAKRLPSNTTIKAQARRATKKQVPRRKGNLGIGGGRKMANARSATYRANVATAKAKRANAYAAKKRSQMPKAKPKKRRK